MGGPLYESSKEIVRAYLLAQELLKKLTIGPVGSTKPCISIEQLQDVIVAETGCAVEKSEVAFPAVHIRERIERYDGGKRAVIHVRQDQDDSWKRFVTAKALLHIKIDREDADFCPYGDETLEELIRRGHFGQASMPELAGEPPHSEVLAEMAALEVLYPLSLRTADIAALEAKTTTIVRLAHRYGIPPSYAATALDARYLAELMKCFEENKNGNGD